jgi:integrase
MDREFASMARTVRNAKIDTRSSRSRLAGRREPYWTLLSRGCAIGYRRGSKGGTWIGRFRTEDGRQHYERLGAADDARDPDNLTVFSFAQAQERARAFFNRAAKHSFGDIEGDTRTVETTLKAYFQARESRGSKGVRADRYVAEARIVPVIGFIELEKLTSSRIRDWLTKLAGAPKLVRTPKGATVRKTKRVETDDTDAIRARRATANRVLTILKAALNHAFAEGHIASDEAWRKVKPFREVDMPVVRFLSLAECKRLVNACERDFRELVRGALLTGCRYGELIRMTTSDYNATSGTVTVRLSKSGKPRHVALTDEGQALFAKLTAGVTPLAAIFRRSDDGVWKSSHQQRPLMAASKRAKIQPAATFHILRHTYASMLAMRGVPLGVIAAQLGHADTRMTERHYAHLSPGYIADTVRASLPNMDLVGKTNIASFEHLNRATADLKS